MVWFVYNMTNDERAKYLQLSLHITAMEVHRMIWKGVGKSCKHSGLSLVVLQKCHVYVSEVREMQ